MNYYEEIKKELVNNEVYKRVKDYSKNKSDLSTYYNVGKLLVEAQGGEKRAKYGNGLIKEYSNKLTEELGKGYSTRNLKLMRKFYLFQKGQALPAQLQLTWSHYIELLNIEDINKINYYIKITEEQNLSYRELHNKIKSNEYERLDDNTKNNLINKEESSVVDFVKNPIIVRNSYNYTEISEKVLQKLILEDIESFMKELGNSFSFVGSEYKIKLGNRYNYIDLLLFNIKYNCYVVIELKVTELKKEYIGQINLYMNYIDKNIKSINQDKTIGIIICKKDNHFVMEYCSDDRIYRTTYELN
ncbi:MAG: PDDEXK nuclease domain-containing protein [Bacilli bacterium]